MFRKLLAFWVLSIGLLSSSAAFATTCPAYPYTLTNGTTADATQVMGNFNSILTCANTSLAPLASPSFTGNVGIGSAPVAANTLEIQATISSGTISSAEQQIITYTGSTATSRTHGVNTQVEFQGTVNNTFTGNGGGAVALAGYGTNNSAGFTLAQATGVFGQTNVTGTAAVTTDGAAFQAALPSVNSGDTITSAYGLWVRGGSVSGTITNHYGLYVEDLVSGTSRFGVYQAGASDLNYFAGSVGIGTTMPAVALTVVGDIRTGTSGTNGCVQNFAGTALTGTCSSDAALKTVTGDVAGILDKIAELQLVHFRWNATAAAVYHDATDVTNTGFVAQEVETRFPELVSRDAHGYRQLNYATLSLYGLEAVKELKARNDKQASEITRQEAEIIELRGRLDQRDRKLASLATASRRQAASLHELRSEVAALARGAHLRTAAR